MQDTKVITKIVTYKITKLSDDNIIVVETNTNQRISFSVPQCVYALLEENDTITLSKITVTDNDGEHHCRYKYNNRDVYAMENADNINSATETPETAINVS